jgi:hypothetical protein
VLTETVFMSSQRQFPLVLEAIKLVKSGFCLFLTDWLFIYAALLWDDIRSQLNSQIFQ